MTSAPASSSISRSERTAGKRKAPLESIKSCFSLAAVNPQDQSIANSHIASFNSTRFHQLLVRWVVIGNRPFTEVEDANLRAICNLFYDTPFNGHFHYNKPTWTSWPLRRLLISPDFTNPSILEIAVILPLQLTTTTESTATNTLLDVLVTIRWVRIYVTLLATSITAG
ncbi:uncharacterized protein BCR38DRAFT_412448 [Pseudomassariella vexata]|uniref:Uncharacterized protein n=1 Tax=Pseudomassariella vexata TaxID=1141098 RepID=A0A1Y2DM21_9PEZI|nr:uncharacterized protein BCR38DRAFT_412448 [Pseudomassariella vexata]ORY60271.1 hypothetical protein BCR38DRAFT_412448 [Pseudomassariella vexata]